MSRVANGLCCEDIECSRQKVISGGTKRKEGEGSEGW